MDMVMKKELLLVVELDQVGHTDMCDASDNANLFVNYVDGRTGLALDPEKGAAGEGRRNENIRRNGCIRTCVRTRVPG